MTAELVGQGRTERRCPDPTCTWTYVEPPTNRWLGDRLPNVPWAGSVQATVRASIDAAVVQDATERAELFDLAALAHLRQHDADDPIGWAERMAGRSG